MNTGKLHRTLAAGVFACGANPSDGARGTPRPSKVTCEQCKKRFLARQDKDKTSLRLLTEIRERLARAVTKGERP